MGLAPILVIDDESEMRSALSHALTRNGFSVESAASGMDALVRIKKDPFSLVITDIKMPEMSGMEVLGAVKKLTPGIPVIVITAYGSIHNAVEAMQAGAADYLLKPFSFETLNATVKKVLDCTDSNGCGQTKQNTKVQPTIKTLVTEDPKLLDILKLAKSVATSRSTILIQGESGTGKELLAVYIHENSGFNDEPYVAVNCAALPDTLAESELFGHEKGAFTGAVNRKMGKFELAKHGTVVLDEISEMTLPLQAKLLRVLQEREIDRVGGSRSVPMHARVVAISNVDLKKAISQNKFREDLYYRINVVPFTIPALDERKGDIPLLVEHFLEKYAQLNNQEKKKISDAAMTQLVNKEWKGNIRELENSIERAVLIGSGPELLPEHLFFDPADSPSRSQSHSVLSMWAGTTVKEMEKQLITKTLEEVNDNRTHAAELLGISIRTLRNKLREYKQELEASQAEVAAQGG
ncbi:MAG: sigma-54 dependent transcriptional regulator [Desulfobacterales bacterium]|nr:sigma-54 dependent transcriptional regulator [Desulfobacterales bacterium]MDH3826589.1 sigma-54 dependent transcriptional regulator [Desulfobacterales bacterium]